MVTAPSLRRFSRGIEALILAITRDVEQFLKLG
jgi:hypothetical protein